MLNESTLRVKPVQEQSRMPRISLKELSSKEYARLEAYYKEMKRADEYSERALVRREAGEKIPDFNIRGWQFRAAMRFGPHVRDREIRACEYALNPMQGEVGLELASGSGYLTKNILDWTQNDLWAIDPSKSQLNALRRRFKHTEYEHLLHPVKGVPDDPNLLRKGPFRDLIGYFDFVVSLAGVHHVEDHHRMLKNLGPLIKTRDEGGRIIIVDAAEETRSAKYLDDVAGEYSYTGHKGNYLSTEKLHKVAKGTGLEVKNAKIVPALWRFEDFLELPLFLKGLHGLKGMDLYKIAQEANEAVGWIFFIGQRGKKNSVYLIWDLLVAELVRKGVSRSLIVPEKYNPRVG